MNILAAIQMLVNSNPEKPLDIKLDELTVNARKATRIVSKVIGVPYNETDDAQVLTLADTPVFSINGTGRILEIFPVTQKDNTRSGTAILSVDGEIILNNRVYYAYGATTRGAYIVTDLPSDEEVSLDVFGTPQGYGFYITATVRSDPSVFAVTSAGVYAPNGIPFKNNFEMRLTQSNTPDTTKNGVLVVYELYE